MPTTPTSAWRLDDGQIEVVDPAMVEILRNKSPAEKVAIVSAAHRTARHLIAAGIRYRHPDWTDDQIATEVARRLSCGTE